MDENTFELKTAENIYSELAKSRACYERGEFEEFDDALDEISKKYKLDDSSSNWKIVEMLQWLEKFMKTN